MKQNPEDQNIAGEVLGRLTGSDSRVNIIPGIYYWRRPNKFAKCYHCSGVILRGDEEIAICKGKNHHSELMHNHYHAKCFIEVFANHSIIQRLLMGEET